MGVLGSFWLPDNSLLGLQWCAIVSLISWASPHRKGMESCHHFVANVFLKYGMYGLIYAIYQSAKLHIDMS